MSSTLRLGDYNTLTVSKRVPFGVYLDDGADGEILLPQRYVPAGTAVGDTLTVFIYRDHDERLIATTEQPLAKVGDFASLEVAWVNTYGAFLRWGLMKDLFCPFREQRQRMKKGERHVVYIRIDDESQRLVATAKVERYLSRDISALHRGQKVPLLVWQQTEQGFKVIIANRYGGMLYADQLFTPLHCGDRCEGYIQTLRDDGKVDVALQATGRRQTKTFAHTLLAYLHDNDGRCALGDKSEAQAIYNTFHVSKKVFKKGVGDLYRQRLITLGDDGIHLVTP